MTEQEIGWLAGIFEGEGSAGVYQRGVMVFIAMTDQDVMEKVQRLFPTPRGLYRRHRNENHKPIYEWRLGQRSHVAEFLQLILPLLGARRKAQAEKVIARATDDGGLGSGHRRKTHCPHGHAYDEANTFIDHRGHRGCRRCRREHSRRRRARERTAA